MTTLTSVTLEVDDLPAARDFYRTAFDLEEQIELREVSTPTSGFRGFTLSVLVAQPATANGFIDTAVQAGATIIKPPVKSFWGYGAVLQAPDGTIWQVATSSKKDTGPATRDIEGLTLLLGVADVAATKRLYAEHGLEVSKSYGRKYVEFATPSSPVSLALYGRKALAKTAGVPVDGSGSHRLIIGSDTASFTDPDGFVWEHGV